MAIDNQTPQILPNAIASQASSADINVIPNTTTEYGAVSVAKGFPTETRLPLTSGGVPPKQQDMNGLLNLISSHSIFLQNGGTWTFNQDVSDAIGGYAANTILWYFPPDESPYQVRSMINDNTYNFVTSPEYIDGDHWEQVTSSGGGQGMPIGTIYALSCSAGYVPEGGLPLDGAQYTKAQFTPLWNNYLTGSDPLLLTCSYADYASDIATYGQCMKWAVDTVNETFKVPTIKDGSFIQQALSDSELGKCYKAGVPNITGTANSDEFPANLDVHMSGAFYVAGTSNNTQSGSSQSSIILGFDASRSNSIYGNSNTVQPEAVALRYFVVVANGEINESMMDWAAWASSLSGKLNTDGSNLGTGTGQGTVRAIVETYVNGTSWCRIYSDKWCEQFGQTTIPDSTNAHQVYLLKEMRDTNYSVFTNFTPNSPITSTSGAQEQSVLRYVGAVYDKAVLSFKMQASSNNTGKFDWAVLGYIK